MCADRSIEGILIVATEVIKDHQDSNKAHCRLVNDYRGLQPNDV